LVWGGKEKMREESKECEDFFHGPEYARAQCAWENYQLSIRNSSYVLLPIWSHPSHTA